MSKEFTPEELEHQYKIQKMVKDVIYENMVDNVHNNAWQLVNLLKHNKKDLKLLADSLDLVEPDRIDDLPDQIEDIDEYYVLEDLFVHIVDRVLSSLGWEHDTDNYEWRPPGYDFMKGPRPKALLAVHLRDSNVPEYYGSLDLDYNEELESRAS